MALPTIIHFFLMLVLGFKQSVSHIGSPQGFYFNHFAQGHINTKQVLFILLWGEKVRFSSKLGLMNPAGSSQRA